MSSEKSRYKIIRLKNRYLTLRLLEILLLALATLFLVLAILSLLRTSLVAKILITIVASVLVIAQRVTRYRLLKLDNQLFVWYLNSKYPQLEQSADLLFYDNDCLTGLESLQVKKIVKRFDELYPEIKIPNLLVQSIAILIASIASYFFLTSFIQPLNTSSEKVFNLLPSVGNGKKTTAFISFLSITIVPPIYTGIPSFESTSSDLKMPENSKVIWSLRFSSPVNEAKIILSGKDSIHLMLNNDTYRINSFVKESGFYQIQWRDGYNVLRSDYFKIEVVKDQVPKVTIENLNQFTKLSFSNPLKVQIDATLTDDYGLTSSTVVATVSKGSGESVKFREEKLHFDTPDAINGKKVKALLAIDLFKIGMEPGDELYFYVEALDNKTPYPSYSRTETFFIALQDTTQQLAVNDEGLGVDLMPEYFRSQRQIIIDTEKLLKEKKRKTLYEFKSTSNELGYDQKVLRLRYGQFLGEEFEGQIGKASVMEEESHESTIEKFGHVHDKENEHNLVADKKLEAPSHSHEGASKDSNKNPLEEFAHNHDDGERSTFFVQSVRAKLKAALTVMWDAELQLRLYEPEKSLPYQYTALKLLKEISNDSRIYVHRTGFDPPPLKEERRLSGDLKEIHNYLAQSEEVVKEVYPEIRNTLAMIEELLEKNVSLLSTANKNQLHKAGQELALIAIEEPGRFMEALTLLKGIEEHQMTKKELAFSLLTIQKILWRVLPQQSLSPSKAGTITHSLEQQFMESLRELKHE